MIPHLIFCPGPGQTIPIANGKGAAATPDYKALYFELFRANEQAIRLLTAAQQKAEAQVMEEDREPLYVHGQPAHNAAGAGGGAGGRGGGGGGGGEAVTPSSPLPLRQTWRC